jgi:hypothetical protein
MTTPICLGWPWIHLDGLLAHLARRELDGQNYYVLPSKEPVQPGFYLGVLGSLGPIHRGSISILQPEELHTMTVYKRFHAEGAVDMPWKLRYVSKGTGPLRDWMIRLPYAPAETVTFYGHGNLPEVLRLLSFLPALGKKTAYGFGAFHSVEVEELPKDRSVVHEGRAMRPIPVGMLEEADETMITAYRSPYWAKENVAECARPGSRVRLRPEWEEKLWTP